MVLKGSQAHQRYQTKDGTYVPGVTSITGRTPKPFLYKWANGLGLKGVSYDEYMKITAEIGTAVHDRIEEFFGGPEWDRSMVRPEHMQYVQYAMDKFAEWYKKHDVEKVYFIEEEMVSEEYAYGGTLDMYAKIDGKRTVLDFKTGKDIYDSHYLQLAALKQLLIEQGKKPEDSAILSLGRVKGDGYKYGKENKENMPVFWQRFLCLLDDYWWEHKLTTPVFYKETGPKRYKSLG